MIIMSFVISVKNFACLLYIHVHSQNETIIANQLPEYEKWLSNNNIRDFIVVFIITDCESSEQ